MNIWVLLSAAALGYWWSNWNAGKYIPAVYGEHQTTRQDPRVLGAYVFHAIRWKQAVYFQLCKNNQKDQRHYKEKKQIHMQEKGWEVLILHGSQPASTNGIPLGTVVYLQQGEPGLFRLHSLSCLHRVKIPWEAENKTTGYQKVGFFGFRSKNRHPLCWAPWGFSRLEMS